MRNVELVVQVKKIQNIDSHSTSAVKDKTVIDFDVCSYTDKTATYKNIFTNKNNKLLLFTNMSVFAKEHIDEEDYVLAKGDLRSASEEENIFLPTYIKILNKKKAMKLNQN